MNSSDIEILRASFRPEKIRVLFVGESAPAGGKFFYLENSLVFTELRRALEPLTKTSTDFLTAFKGHGFYLDDIVLTPVNWLGDSERRRLRAESLPSLAARLADYQPQAIVSFMKAIRSDVATAQAMAGLACPYFCVSFPGNGQQGHFRREMNEVIPKLISLGIL